jgi:hypothetical protein
MDNMMKVIYVLMVALLVSCSTQDSRNGSVTTPKDSSQPKAFETGWNSNDIYIVQAKGENITKAKQKARLQILKDIVNVRVRSQSAYTELEKISKEFDDLFKNASILRQRDVTEGVEIYYQIKEPGLKFKFERK